MNTKNGIYTDVIMAGFGGQGILLIGNLLAEAALLDGYMVTYFPSYGVEMRGGTVNCTVVISDEEIGSPQVSSPETLLVMSEQARERFEPKLKPSGLLIANSTLVDISSLTRKDVEVLAFPFNQIGTDMGNVKFANMLALGIYLGKKPVVKISNIEQALKNQFGEKKKELIDLNLRAIEKGIELALKTGG